MEIMKSLSHPNLIPLLDYYDEESKMYLITPICTGGELFDELTKRKTYTEEDARQVMKKIADALQYIHSKGIVHRDLKPQNILLKSSALDSEIFIADFGFARSESKLRRRGTQCGTPSYIAPEIVQGKAYGCEVDCWSLGVILYILLCGSFPFHGENHHEILSNVSKGDYHMSGKEWENVTENAKDLVKKLLCINPSRRLTARGVLSHPWINEDHESPQKQQIQQYKHKEKFELNTEVHDELKKRSRRNSDLSSALKHMKNLPHY